jgi:uncharacterized glyoxalase superfamily protein PhnB
MHAGFFNARAVNPRAVVPTPLSYQRAIDPGATPLHSPRDEPRGERVAGVKDVFGNQWFIATQIGDRG